MTCTEPDYEKIEPDFGRYDFEYRFCALFMRIAEYYVQRIYTRGNPPLEKNRR